ncbi:MAG: hypothetical protein ACR2OB_02425 [Solirubrobacteraceae bacterium]
MKFLSPIVTGGLPTPGPLLAAGVDAAGAGVLAVTVGLALLVVELLDELPHAASARASATITILAGVVLK